MAKAGDSYEITLSDAHLEWGEYRRTQTRGRVLNEAYIPIPAECARRFGLYNGNHGDGNTLGENIFRCVSADGRLNAILRAQGCNAAGEIYAKQFSVNEDLKALGNWFNAMGASVGDKVKVEFTSDVDITITLIKK